ncbi:hypothetical protein Deba_0519 [Desulfarculus baarsii DSM 2075]|uniref:Uncharacterized protein n=1 Tax=Desulfarculus baarsii (strain ATCC 33931 / DSM 2075 / LMG 7858 / VKM B-1802 / 2st14) TaxID=644282 RepID=E1QEA5_DESB2|nr:hypothetical protein [Desulfarculus baarsii]ADK83891.1 hypothetical protein Deba_0519 [Desulfarculus baarsii DSM 2075]
MLKPNSDAWLQSHCQQLIDCPNQPGKLRISAASCAKRYDLANQSRYQSISGDSQDIVAFKFNLAHCRGCEIGAAMAGKDAAA